MKSANIFLLVICAFLAAGFPLMARKPTKAQKLGAELEQAPLEARTWKNPYAGQGEAVFAGRKLFKRHCAQCHGNNGQGKDKAPDLRLPFVQNAPPGTLFWFLRNGNLKEGMPSWSRLPDQQLWQIVAYLKTLD